MTWQAIVDSTFIGDGLSQNRDMQARDSLLPDREELNPFHPQHFFLFRRLRGSKTIYLNSRL